ncbi:acyltransferase [Agrobacterium sp. BA1120]|uniref:acyltransferase family protein n=1 Tax=Agrobacterium sp. BA1120 TaxID=3228927 RepID=UPI00336A613A
MQSSDVTHSGSAVPVTVVLDQGTARRPANRYENIDALRAIAALAVVVQHFFGDIIREATDQQGVAVHVASSSVSYFDAGRFGVVLFFLISGFVVPFSIKGSYPLHRFAISRFVRLFPAMWLALFCLAAASLFHGQTLSLPTFLANMTMLPASFRQPWMSGAYWTLTIELVFYALSAGLFALGALYRPAIIALFAILLALATAIPILLRSYGISLPVQYISLHVSFLYLGLLLRMTLIDRLAGAKFGAIGVLLTQAIILLTIGEFSLSRQDGFFLVGSVPILISYVAALCVFVFSVKTGMPNHPLLSWLGALSYSIYLFHGIAALLVFAFLPLTGTWADLPIGITSLVLTILISVFVYEYLEKPMINLGYRFIRREDNTESKIAV